MDQLNELAYVAESFEALPTGAFMVLGGQPVSGDGGTWVPGVFKVGPAHYQAAVVPLGGGGKAVAGPVVWTSQEVAETVAGRLTELAAG